jgi:hypothetical protein
MWLVGLAQHGLYALLQALRVPSPHPLDTSGRAFHSEVAASVLPVALAIALGVLLTWRLLKQLFGKKAAWAGAGFLALDPFHIATSQMAHIDALFSVLMILSALTLLLFLQQSAENAPRRPFRPHYRLLLLSGVLAGLACLTKSMAYFLVPFFALSLAVTRRQARRWRDDLMMSLLWAGTAFATYVLLWPAMWVQAGRTLAMVAGDMFKQVHCDLPQSLCYLDSPAMEQPGLSFYSIVLLAKTTALTLPLFIIGLVSPFTSTWSHARQTLGLLIAYFVLFFVQTVLRAENAPCYLLPAFPALDIIAGIGLLTLVRHSTSWNVRIPSGTLTAAALILQAALVLPYHSHYTTHASLLTGGPAGAQHLLPAIQEGEGLNLVADYLNHLSNAERLRVGVQSPVQTTLRQYFVGEVTDIHQTNLDYVVFVDACIEHRMAEEQWREQWETYKHREPEYTAALGGVPYAWLYRADDGPQQPAVPLQVCLGEHIRMLGHTTLAEGAPPEGQLIRPGESIQVTLHWMTTGTPEGDYSVFVHLLGPDGALVTQQDNVPLHGTYPTFLWETGERLDDPYELTIPPDAPSGSYTLTVGMYDWRTGERLTALENCRLLLTENRITLTTFEMEPRRAAWWQVLAWVLDGALILIGLAAARPKAMAIRRWARRRWMPLTYLLLSVLMTFPVSFQFGTHYIGGGTDLWVFPWEDWWCLRCLLEGRNPFFTTSIFYPHGVSAVYHNFAWLNTSMWIPLSPLIGPVAAHNLIFLFNLALAGIGMHSFVHYLTKDHQAALLAGMIFAFWPYRMSHFNHPNMISVGWVPLCMLFLARTIQCKGKRSDSIREEPKLKLALLTGLFFALTGIARWMHLIYTSGLILVYLLHSVLFERKYWNQRTIVALVVTFACAALLMAPLLSPLVVVQIRGGQQAEDIFIPGGDAFGTDLVSYFVPERGHPLFLSLLGDLWGRMRRGAYLGYVALILAGVGLLKGPRDRALWFVAGAGLFILALGSELQVAGHQLDISLPYSWVQDWPPVRVMRHPHRFNILLSFPLAVLAAYGMAWLAPRLKRPTIWTLGLAALILIEYLPWPYPTSRAGAPPFYQELACETGDFAILDLPLGPSGPAKLYMYYSTFHGKALVGGRVARLPRTAYAFIDSIPLLEGLHKEDEMDPALGDVSRQLSVLAQANVRYVVLHPILLTPDRLTRWQEWLVISPFYEDHSTIVYRTAPQYGQDFDFKETIGDGIGVIDMTLLTPAVPQGQKLEVEVTWGTRKAPQRDWLVRISLVHPSGTEIRRTVFAPCAGWSTERWGENAVARGRGVLEVDASVEAGTYTVTLTLVDSATDTQAAEPLIVGQVEVLGTAHL